MMRTALLKWEKTNIYFVEEAMLNFGLAMTFLVVMPTSLYTFCKGHWYHLQIQIAALL